MKIKTFYLLLWWIKLGYGNMRGGESNMLKVSPSLSLFWFLNDWEELIAVRVRNFRLFVWWFLEWTRLWIGRELREGFEGRTVGIAETEEIDRYGRRSRSGSVSTLSLSLSLSFVDCDERGTDRIWESREYIKRRMAAAQAGQLPSEWIRENMRMNGVREEQRGFGVGECKRSGVGGSRRLENLLLVTIRKTLFFLSHSYWTFLVEAHIPDW